MDRVNGGRPARWSAATDRTEFGVLLLRRGTWRMIRLVYFQPGNVPVRPRYFADMSQLNPPAAGTYAERV